MDHDHMHMSDGPSSDPPLGVHGMAVLGHNDIYLSHLPMFHAPHDYQVLVKASFGAAGQIYLDDVAAHPEVSLYTFFPEQFVLSDLWPGSAGEPPRRTSFSGRLFRHHFEQPEAHPEEPVALASDVTVEVEEVLYHRRFDPDARRPEQLTYVLVGAGDERYLAHAVTRAPEFDQLVALEPTDGLDVDSSHDAVDLIVPSRSDDVDQRIRAGEKVTVSVEPGRTTEIRARTELYVETADLSR